MEGRTKNVFKNVSSNFFLQFLKTIFSFITRTVFIYCLGKEALGLNSLFTNILSMLSLAELGISSAINFSLYEPLAKNDTEKINCLMNFYKKTYIYIGIIISILGIALTPLLHFFIKDISSIQNVYFIYYLFLFNTVSTYFISYKETLITADQKAYKLVGIQVVFLLIMNILQILILLKTKNFILYLIIQFFVQFIQRIVCNIFISKEYNNLNFNTKDKLSKSDLSIIIKNVKAMFFHKIGDYCVNSTDNLIISAFLSVSIVGLYSNYLTILNMISMFTSVFFTNLTASLGNLNVSESSEKKYSIFKKIDFMGFIIYGFCFVLLINVFNDFISLWVGEEYCLNFYIVLAIVFSYFVSGLRISAYTMKSAAGLYDVDKYSPLIQAFINLFISIILARYIGLLGIVLGTIISSLVLPSWQRPYIVYKYLFNKKFSEYVVKYFKNLMIIAVITCLTLFINNFIKCSLLIKFVVECLVTSIVFLFIIYIFYHKKEEFIYLKELLFNILKLKKREE